MDKILIDGGVRLEGTIQNSGSKNATLPCMTASLLARGLTVLEGVPRLKDIEAMADLLKVLGAKTRLQNHTLSVDSSSAEGTVAPYDIVRKMRASIYVLGPLLARFGEAKVSLPGGCAIGDRPVDLHMKGMQCLGAEVRLEHGYVLAHAHKLRGAEIDLSGPRGTSVGATINVMSAAVLAEGQTRLLGAAREPEVVDTARLLTAMGAQIQGAGERTITIEGVTELCPSRMRIIPDRIEAGTFLMAAAMTGGRVRVEGCQPDHLEATLQSLARAGVRVTVTERAAEAIADSRLRPIELVTGTYPEFPTDMQAQFMALLSLADGVSHISDHIYPDRFMHVRELTRLGAKIARVGNQAEITGVSHLSAAPVMASDLRASAALILAGLAAKGVTEIRRVYHIDRGYERIEDKLSSLGARIWREKE